MTIRPILTAPDPRLKAVSADVGTVDGEIRKLVDDMAESMYAAEGIGLAAVQIRDEIGHGDIDQARGGKGEHVRPDAGHDRDRFVRQQRAEDARDAGHR